MSEVEHPGLRVKYEIYSQGMTASEFCSYAGLATGSLNDLVIQRHKKPRRSVLYKVSQSLGLEIEELFKPLTKNELNKIDKLKLMAFQQHQRLIRCKYENKAYKEKILRSVAAKHGMSYDDSRGKGKGFKKRGTREFLIDGLKNDQWYSLYKQNKLDMILDGLK